MTTDSEPVLHEKQRPVWTHADGGPDIGSARSAFLEVVRLQGKARCPTCAGMVALYRRPLTSSMAYALALLVQEARRRHHAGEEPGIHAPSFLSSAVPPELGAVVRGGDFAKLRFWGFLQEVAGERDDGSTRTGFWRVTPAGIDFADGVTDAPAAVFVAQGEAQGFAVERVTFREALGTRFSFAAIHVEGGMNEW